MGSEGPRDVVIHVTGFKKFQGVAKNPTETIVNNLKDFVEKRGLPAGVTLGSCTVLETAGDGALPSLYKILESGTAAANNDKREQVVWVSFNHSQVFVVFRNVATYNFDPSVWLVFSVLTCSSYCFRVAVSQLLWVLHFAALGYIWRY